MTYEEYELAVLRQTEVNRKVTQSLCKLDEDDNAEQTDEEFESVEEYTYAAVNTVFLIANANVDQANEQYLESLKKDNRALLDSGEIYDILCNLEPLKVQNIIKSYIEKYSPLVRAFKAKDKASFIKELDNIEDIKDLSVYCYIHKTLDSLIEEQNTDTDQIIRSLFSRCLNRDKEAENVKGLKDIILGIKNNPNLSPANLGEINGICWSNLKQMLLSNLLLPFEEDCINALFDRNDIKKFCNQVILKNVDPEIAKDYLFELQIEAPKTIENLTFPTPVFADLKYDTEHPKEHYHLSVKFDGKKGFHRFVQLANALAIQGYFDNDKDTIQLFVYRMSGYCRPEDDKIIPIALYDVYHQDPNEQMTHSPQKKFFLYMVKEICYCNALEAKKDGSKYAILQPAFSYRDNGFNTKDRKNIQNAKNADERLKDLITQYCKEI